MIFQGVRDDGYYYVSGHTKSYRVPADLRTADEIRAWVIRQLKAGNIDKNDLYQDQKAYSNPLDALARIPVPGTGKNLGDVTREVVTNGQQQVNRILHPYGNAKPWKGELGGAQLTATPVGIKGKQITWRIEVERGGQKLGAFETKLTGQIGPAQFKEGSPLKKQVLSVLSQPQTRVLDTPAGDPIVFKKGNYTWVTQLYEQQGWKDGRWQKTGYVTKGVSVYSETPLNSSQKREQYGFFGGSAPGKLRLITEAENLSVRDADRTPITDQQKARARVEEIFNYGGLTIITDEQALTAQKIEQRRQERIGQLPDPLNQKIKAPRIDYSSSPTTPNTIQGNFDPRTVERGQTNVSFQSQSTDGKPNLSVMIVPNIVFEQGLTGNDKKNISVTPQPFTLFAPVSGGLPGFHTETNGRALYRSTLHPAGFYPGDPNWQRWQDAYTEHPESTPEYQVRDLGYARTIRTDNWYQVYWNSPNGLNPLDKGSFNQREISQRQEVRVGFYQQRTTALGRDSSQMLLTPYSWAQVHFKAGFANVALPNRNPYAKLGLQEELGVYLWLNNAPVDWPWGSVDLEKLKVKDWHIVNGSITDDKKAFENQFQDIYKKTGLVLRSESVVPDWDDRSAAVYLQIPISGAGNPEWVKIINQGMIVSGNETYLPVSNLVSIMNKLGTDFEGKYKEFKFVSLDQLLALNQDRLVKVKDPKTGNEVLAVKAGTWVNTGTRVSVGGPGLFLPNGASK